MPRTQGRHTGMQLSQAAAGRLRDIEAEINEILRRYPDLVHFASNSYSISSGGGMGPHVTRMWRRRERSIH